MTLESNLPISLNSQNRHIMSNNMKEAERRLQLSQRLLEEHKSEEQDAHNSKQIKHGDSSTVDKEIKSLRNQVKSQVVGKSDNSAAELKDMRVDTQGELHDLAQDRLKSDFDLLGGVAKMAQDLANKHEEQIQNSAYYNEIKNYTGRKFNTTYYITHIPHLDSDGNLIKLKRGLEGTNPDKPEHITPVEFSRRHNATFVSNASTGSGSQLKLHGRQIYNGRIIDSLDTDYVKDRWTLAISEDNTLTSYPPNVNAQTLLSQGVTNALTAFGPIISDNKVIVKDGDYSPNTTVKHPRQVIGQLPNKDIIFFSCDGRENNTSSFIEEGMTLKEVAEVLFDYYGDIQFAYNLDGGGSTSSVLRSTKLNKAQDENFTADRPVLDFLYVGRDERQIRDADIQKAYEDIGRVNARVQDIYGKLYKFNRTSSKEFWLTGFDSYSGFITGDDKGNPKLKLYQGTDFWRFWSYDLSRTIFRITPDSLQHNNKELARNYSAPESVTDINSVTYGGTYHVPRNAKGSPYPNVSSSIVTHYNVTYADFSDAATAFQTAIPFIRSANYKMKRRTYAQGKWSQWFDV